MVKGIINNILGFFAKRAWKGPPPPPVETGFVFQGESIFDYVLDGTWDEDALLLHKIEASQTTPSHLQYWEKLSIEKKRTMMDQNINRKEFQKSYKTNCTTSSFVINTTDTPGCDNPSLRILCHTPLALQDATDRPAIIYFHGGGPMFGSPELWALVCCRIAEEAGVVVFSVGYRLSPEHKAPASAMDGVGAFLHVVDNAEQLGVDPHRVCIAGDSGGGYVASATCVELARRGLPNTASLLLLISPIVSDVFSRGGLEPVGVELLYPQQWIELEGYLKPEDMDGVDPSIVWPSLCTPEVAAAFPRTVIVTGEFDVLKRGADELASKLQAAGRLVDYLVHPGQTQSWFLNHTHPHAPVFYADVSRICERYLK
eukprot:gnl/Dysnectes_brevis/1765_a2014_1338.p1 GENE.gnl/Dysnectes_brevis/1765_a2014_1338~~gnl/Dysnectes_brevis/1765_a2014_1338.p1  ORF type:complete len:371 (+),score=63.48 gnl/Dysnectes_brevis/1765_a2014_1338:569-1681(+)